MFGEGAFTGIEIEPIFSSGISEGSRVKIELRTEMTGKDERAFLMRRAQIGSLPRQMPGK